MRDNLIDIFCLKINCNAAKKITIFKKFGFLGVIVTKISVILIIEKMLFVKKQE